MGPLQRASITDILYEILKRSSWPPPPKKKPVCFMLCFGSVLPGHVKVVLDLWA